jgi:hypothetical protein
MPGRLQNGRSQRNKSRKSVRAGKPTHSTYRGVTRELNNLRKPWKAAIKTNGKNKNLGRFKLEAEAAQAYQDALLIYPL